MIIKSPACYDVAGSYQKIADWGKVNPRPLFVVCKATEGNFYRDPYFKINFAGLAVNGIKRGAYHFFRKAINSTTQANYFCDYVRDTLRPDDYIILDMEEGGETIAQIFAWFDGIEAQYLNEIILYSNEDKINALAAQCTPAQLTRLRSYKTWIAAYPANPDLYASIPAGYIPAGFTVWMWQYSSSAHPDGIVATSVDVNWLAPEFIAKLEGATPPTGETMSYKGTVVKTVRIRNADNTDAGGLLYAGDVVYGEVKLSYGLNRIFYNRIYRKDGTVKPWVGNSALIDGGVTLITTQAGFTDPAEVVTPPPAPTKPVSVTVTLDGYKPLTLSGEMEQA